MDSLTKPKKILLITVITLSVVLFFTFLYFTHLSKSQNKLMKVQENSETAVSRAKHEMEEFTFTEYVHVNGRTEKSFVVSAERMQAKPLKVGIFRLGVGFSLEMENPEIVFYKGDAPISRARSSMGSVNPMNKHIILSNAPMLITNDKRILTCKSLEWDNENKQLIAKGKCFLKIEGKLIEAEAIKAGPALQEYSIIK